jgi:hypothetical protein
MAMMKMTKMKVGRAVRRKQAMMMTKAMAKMMILGSTRE